MRLANKTALITGAARGIGAATAKLMAAEGAKVIVTDILDEEGDALVKELGDGAAYYHLDVASEADWSTVERKITSDGNLDILFNNAGIIGRTPHIHQDPEFETLEHWRHVMDVNLSSVFLGCRTAIRLMKKSGGSIINMASRSGIVGQPKAAAYAASKAAIRNHTRTVALYCAEQGYAIRCNSVSPAAILTPIWEPMWTDVDKETAIAKMSANIPIGHMGSAMDVAYAVVYLGSDEASYQTGSEIILDGGILAGSAASPKPMSSGQ